MRAKVARSPLAPCTSTMGKPWPERRAARLVPSADVIVNSWNCFTWVHRHAVGPLSGLLAPVLRAGFDRR